MMWTIDYPESVSRLPYGLTFGSFLVGIQFASKFVRRHAPNSTKHHTLVPKQAILAFGSIRGRLPLRQRMRRGDFLLKGCAAARRGSALGVAGSEAGHALVGATIHAV